MAVTTHDARFEAGTPASARRATYRLQLTPAFGFADAGELVEPLARLGVSHLYLSPIAQAVPDSEHGYDVVDHSRVRAEFGGADALWSLLDRVAQAGLRVIVDHVPNHVSISRPELNPHWWAMLRDGPESPAADWFDVDWEAGAGRVIVPRLGAPLADVLASGALTVRRDVDGASLAIGDLRLPLRTGTEELEPGELLAAQHYELTWWRSPERNVRRFFTIDDLVAVRVEDDDVRRGVDTLLPRLAEHAAFDGVRIDHVDGLADPGGYLHQLRELLGADRWILVEKILGPGESLPADWPVDGTTGYEFLSVSEHVLADPSGEAALSRFARTLASGPGNDEDDEDADGSGSYHSTELAARREVLDGGLRPDLDRVVRTALDARSDVSERSDEWVRPDGGSVVDGDDLRRAITELTLGLDRYRTYLPDDPESRRVFAQLVDRTRQAHPDLATAISLVAALVERSPEVRTRWQQLTGPAMAKGAEDRAFYRHVRLAGWNEVGGRPDGWALAPDEFHRHQHDVATTSPCTMLASTTHDTKRSSGVRSRSLALTAVADRFARAAADWLAAHRHVVEGVAGSDVSIAIQTAVTAWPIDEVRLHRFLVKCAREADLHTSWIEPNDAYETALGELAIALCDALGGPDEPLASLAVDLDVGSRHVDEAWTVLHLTAPGVPDLYQGMPLALRSLVDPDNRIPPDWAHWRRVVELADRAIEDGAVPASGDRTGDVARTRDVMALLRLRSRAPDAFGPGAGYHPLPARGTSGHRVVAYSRAPDGHGEAIVAVAVGPGVSAGDLATTSIELPAGSWYDVLDSDRVLIGGEEVHLVDVLGDRRGVVLHRPVADLA